jgi:hypothetical protein
LRAERLRLLFFRAAMLNLPRDADSGAVCARFYAGIETLSKRSSAKATA